MSATRNAFLVVWVFAMIPAVLVNLSFRSGELLPYVIGSAAVAGMVAPAARWARGIPWYLHAVVALIVASALPLVAGGVTGVAVGVLEHRGPVAHVVDEALLGAFFLFPLLAPAGALAWALALGSLAYTERQERIVAPKLR